MLTISKPLSSAQAQQYHQQSFSNAEENYYSQGRTIQGEWHGKLAAQWGLEGKVSEEHFALLSQGQHPLTGERLVRHRSAYEYVTQDGKTIHAMEHRAGWDATFAAPKSVSLTALVGGDERIREAHRISVQIALNELEKFVQARVGGNHLAESTGKWVAARFEHDSSRPVDGYAAPQLHTHVVVFNIAERKNGDTHAMQPRELYRSQQYATAIYRSELALRLRQLGYEVEQRPNGAPEITGYSQEYLEASSPRRKEIQEHLLEEGASGAARAEIAQQRTRQKKLDISHEEMQQRHLDLAHKYGDQPQRVVRAAEERAAQQLQPVREIDLHRAVVSALNYALDKNLEREAVAEERTLMGDALKRSMGRASLDQIQEEFGWQIQQRRFIEIENRQDQLARKFTSSEMIALERDNIQMMLAGQDQYPPMVSVDARQRAESEHAHLNAGQREAVQQILSSRDQISALEGRAGTGKTTLLAAVREAAEDAGYTVQGFAPTSRAAHQLAEAGMEASTLQRHLVRGKEPDETKRHLYVLDESSLSGTRQVNEFLRRLGEQDRVLLVGDVRQHEGVEAGRPYHQLQEAGMRTAHLDDIIRQKDPDLKHAVEQLAAGQVINAIQELESQGRVHEIVDRDERLRAIAANYVERPERTLVISPDNDARRELNALIHEERQERGQIEEREHKLRVLQARQELTGADRAWVARYEAGDVLRYSRGSKVIGIEAGEYARVTALDQMQNLLTVQRDDGQHIRYDPRRLQGVSVYREEERQFSVGDRIQFTAPNRELGVVNRELGVIESIGKKGNLVVRGDGGNSIEFNVSDHPHIDYGYAVTSHSSQGGTTDRVLIHVDTELGEQLVNERLAYVSVSRARYDAQIYTNNAAELAERLDRDHSHSTAIGLNRSDESSSHGPGYEPGQKIGPQSVGHDQGNDQGHAHAAGESHSHAGGEGMGQGIGE